MKRQTKQNIVAVVTGLVAIGIGQYLPKFFAGLLLIFAGVIIAGIFAQGE